MFTQCAPSLPPRLPLRPVAHPFILHECGRVAGPSFYNQLSDHPEGRILLMHFVLTDFTIPSFLSTFLQHAWNRLWSVCASVLHTFSTCKINSFRLRFSFCASPFASYVAAIAGHLPYIFFAAVAAAPSVHSVSSSFFSLLALLGQPLLTEQPLNARVSYYGCIYERQTMCAMRCGVHKNAYAYRARPQSGRLL